MHTRTRDCTPVGRALRRRARLAIKCLRPAPPQRARDQRQKRSGPYSERWGERLRARGKRRGREGV
eukprot:1419417-Rhodomonas_salina.1